MTPLPANAKRGRERKECVGIAHGGCGSLHDTILSPLFLTVPVLPNLVIYFLLRVKQVKQSL